MERPEEPASPAEGGSAELRSHPLTPTFGNGQHDDASGLETFVGFVGDSPRASAVRVYADLSLVSYCELERSDVVQVRPVDPQDLDGPSIVRVRADARIEYTRIDRFAGDASFVAGALRARYGGGQIDDRSVLDSPVVLKPYPELTPVRYCPSRVCGPFPITPVLYCLSRVYPPCDVYI
jgi:hypothetical protein